MALKGTLKDFGIADILQLIGQQMKSGVLHLQGPDGEIHVALAEGAVVRAEATGRKTREKLGTMLVNAGLLGKDELTYALDVQKRTLRRLGDILRELDLVTVADLREMTALQTTETVYKLFHWKSGTYAFEPGSVEWDPETVTPLRAEAILMEGFRRVDEWPMVRKRVPSLGHTFERAKPFEGAGGDRGSTTGLGLTPGALKLSHGEVATLGESEQKVGALAEPGRTVEQIVDLSRLGEFEACKALANLVSLGYLTPVAPASRAAAVVGYAADWQARIRAGAVRVLATVAIAAAVAGIGFWVDQRGLAWGRPAGGPTLGDDTARRFLAAYQLERLKGALEVYRLERGEYPEQLGQLVDAELASARDLRYPWSTPYFYRRDADRFVLLPPIE